MVLTGTLEPRFEAHRHQDGALTGSVTVPKTTVEFVHCASHCVVSIHEVDVGGSANVLFTTIPDVLYAVNDTTMQPPFSTSWYFSFHRIFKTFS